MGRTALSSVFPCTLRKEAIQRTTSMGPLSTLSDPYVFLFLTKLFPPQVQWGNPWVNRVCCWFWFLWDLHQGNSPGLGPLPVLLPALWPVTTIVSIKLFHFNLWRNVSEQQAEEISEADVYENPEYYAPPYQRWLPPPDQPTKQWLQSLPRKSTDFQAGSSSASLWFKGLIWCEGVRDAGRNK